MKILIEGGDLNPPYVEGTRNIAKMHWEGLLEAGHEVIVLSKRKEINTQIVYPKFEIVRGVKYYRWNNYFELLWALMRIKRENVDAVHIFAKGLRPINYLKLIKNIIKKKIVFTLLGYPFWDKYKKMNFNSFLKNIDLLTIPSKTIFEELNKKYDSKKMIFLRYGINTRRFVPLNKEDNKIKMVCLRIPEEALITAFNKLSAKNKNFELILNRTISSEIIKTNKNDNIKFIDSLPKIENLLGTADILIDLHSGDKFLPCASPPLLLIEAMSCGMKIISSDRKEITEVVENKKNGILIKKGTTNQILGAIKRIKNNNLLGKNARARIEKDYNLQDLNKKYLELYSLNSK
jgi:glycosyltransferase involved in cell wall biosynthesis